VLSELNVYLNHHHVTDMEVNQSHPDDFVKLEMQILVSKVFYGKLVDALLGCLGPDCEL
jgi:hypothetical protein